MITKWKCLSVNFYDEYKNGKQSKEMWKFHGWNGFGKRLRSVENYAQFDVVAEINGKQSNEPFGVNLLAINRTIFGKAEEWWTHATLALPTLLQWLNVLCVCVKNKLVWFMMFRIHFHSPGLNETNAIYRLFQSYVQSKCIGKIHNEIDSKGRTQNDLDWRKNGHILLTEYFQHFYFLFDDFFSTQSDRFCKMICRQFSHSLEQLCIFFSFFFF